MDRIQLNQNGRLQIKSESISSSGPLAKVTLPEMKVGTNADESEQSRSCETHIQPEKKARRARSDDAPEDLSALISHSSRHAVEEPDLPRLYRLEEENRHLKRIVTDQALDIQLLKEVLAKNIATHYEIYTGRPAE